MASPNLPNQEVLNATATILTLMQNLNENINIIIDKLNHYYRFYPDTFNSTYDPSKTILNIFNMTEDDLYKNVAKDYGNSNLKVENNNENYDFGSYFRHEDDFSSEKEVD